MDDARLRRERWVRRDERRDAFSRRTAETRVGPALQRDGGGGHDDARPMVAAHRVQRYANVARHSLVRPPEARSAGGARRGATIAASPRKATP